MVCEVYHQKTAGFLFLKKVSMINCVKHSREVWIKVRMRMDFGLCACLCGTCVVWQNIHKIYHFLTAFKYTVQGQIYSRCYVTITTIHLHNFFIFQMKLYTY